MLLGDAVAITQLLLNYRLICQLLLTECVDDGDSPPTRLISSGDPCRIQERPRNIKLEDMYFLLSQRHITHRHYAASPRHQSTLQRNITRLSSKQKAHIIISNHNRFGNNSDCGSCA